MTKVTEFEGFEVPQDATHFGAESSEYSSAFYKLHNGIWYCCDTASNLYVLTASLPDNLICLPDAEEGFKLEIGTICLGRYGVFADFMECKVVYIDEDNSQRAIALFKGGNQESLNNPVWCEEFKPPQTEEEKAREAFIEAAYCLKNGDAILIDLQVEILLGEMFDAGFKAPEEDK